MAELPLTNSDEHALVDDDDHPLASRHAWRLNEDGHVVRDTVDAGGRPAVVYLRNEVLSRATGIPLGNSPRPGGPHKAPREPLTRPGWSAASFGSAAKASAYRRAAATDMGPISRQEINQVEVGGELRFDGSPGRCRRPGGRRGGGPPRRCQRRGCRMGRRLRGGQDAREGGASSAGSGGTPGKGRR
jgi:hypothetical protein